MRSRSTTGSASATASTSTRSRARRLGGRAALGLGVLALAVAGILLGLRVSGPTEHATPLGDVTLEVGPALRGEIDVYVPIADWGVRVHAFRGPVRLRGEIRSLNRSGVLRAATGDTAIVERARAAVDAAAARALVRAGLFALGGALVGGLVGALALLALRRTVRRAGGAAAVTVLLAALVVAVSGLVARTTFDAGAFERPSFYARGAELQQLLAAATRTQRQVERYSENAENGVRSFSTLLAQGVLGGEGFPATDGEGRTAVLASDLHNNTLAVRSIEGLAGTESPIFLAGDFGHEGNEGEARLLAPRLGRLGDRAIAVSGNHDSARLMRTLADAGVTVLTGGGRLRADGTRDGAPVIDVMGLKVAGVSDPLEHQGDDPGTAERIFSFPELPDGDAARDAAEGRLVRWFDALPERPDVELIHQNGLAQHLAAALHARGGQAPLVILTGHDHKQHVARHGDVVVVDAGTVGAGGVLGVGSEEVGLGELYFAAAGGRLTAVDLIEAEPLTGGAQAERVVVDDVRCDDEEEECRLAG